ncbi:MAG: glycosyltransferase family 4 protein [Saprospiraceae bacterium]|nr:glycosyltransferase family 4 protein [Bacteroidia bacterium]NNE16273.1 glycosyltransferase family 4 protein [Saprospiraceae bacterium]NNL91575.1 glycosyltransferase family 4 protein [Saprospiraceae bacterium]
MKILFILENYYPNIGGVETLFKSLATELAHRQYKITILTNQFDSKLARNENIDGVNIIRVPFKNRYIFTFFAWIKAYKLAKQHDFIHTTSYNAGVPAFIAGWLSRKKVIITFHEVWGKMWLKLPFMNKASLYLHYLFEKLLLNLSFYKFIAVSNATKNSLIKEGIPSTKIEMIHNGIDYGKFDNYQNTLKSTNDTFTFTYFGRLGISKGLDILLESIKILQDKETFKINIIIPRRPEGLLKTIKKIIKENRIERTVHLLHELPEEELFNIVKSSDCVVVPSYSEGFCFTAVETMALKTPIISSGRGALKEVTSGKHLIMESLNPQALADCMNRAINNEFDFVPLKRFDLNDSIEKYIDLYNAINNK